MSRAKRSEVEFTPRIPNPRVAAALVELRDEVLRLSRRSGFPPSAAAWRVVRDLAFAADGSLWLDLKPTTEKRSR